METSFFYATKEKDTQFKSYYVVWKLNSGGSTPDKANSLNRTMQYGNVWIY